MRRRNVALPQGIGPAVTPHIWVYGVRVRNTEEQRREQRKKWGLYFAPIRAATGLSARAFADKIGVSAATVSRWEAGIQKPESPEMVERLSKWLGLQMDEVLAAASLGPGDAEPVEAAFDVDLAIQAILNAVGLTMKSKGEMIEKLELQDAQEREHQAQRRLEQVTDWIRFAGGKVA